MIRGFLGFAGVAGLCVMVHLCSRDRAAAKWATGSAYAAAWALHLLAPGLTLVSIVLLLGVLAYLAFFLVVFEGGARPY